jgi:TPR repeat protein
MLVSKLLLSFIFVLGVFAAPVVIQPPVAPPKSGTAQWHYQKGAEEIMGARGTVNPILANEHFQRAADMGYPPAIKALADSYYSGDGVEKDLDKALFLYLRAADMGDGSAQFNVGVILLKGYANEVTNYPLAFYYLCLATLNPDLDEMAQDAAVYRDEVALKLTADEARQVYTQIANYPRKAFYPD